MNTFGNIFRLTSFGESHGKAIGGVIDGMPAGVKIDLEQIQQALRLRRPGQSSLTTTRNESDSVELLSGIHPQSGLTLGTPIGFIIPNNDCRQADYDQLQHAYRPNHADFSYTAKYGLRDHRGGGRASARETASRVVAGAIAQQALSQLGIRVEAFASQIGQAVVRQPYSSMDMDLAAESAVRCPDPQVAEAMQKEIEQARADSDSVGGTVTCVIQGVPAGIGEPVFGKLQSQLAAAMMSIPAAKGFDYGLGFAAAQAYGSEVVDTFAADKDGNIVTATNYSGGIQGGISNGSDIYFRVAFKPTATIARPLATVNDQNQPIQLKVSGRHDPCVVPRAVEVVKAMARIVVFDAYLSNRSSQF